MLVIWRLVQSTLGGVTIQSLFTWCGSLWQKPFTLKFVVRWIFVLKRRRVRPSLISLLYSKQDSGQRLAKRRIYREEVTNQLILR